ncbi:hypothetical protein BLNAU_11558 [Blattamonas nauphoetae]|uniref:Protein kinase domain-containing protein n=1 Tax=Blattamonas nauphoetae TaxID=2049346 RepID=A0ABQ9XSE3_9EUKA|nr:hypothetical protein BLNAU_11558 [Blattamonas nauphoetae]
MFINGATGVVKVSGVGLGEGTTVGFGVSNVLDFDPMSESKEMMVYYAPESLEGHISAQGDIYSFGMCMLKFLTGSLPYSECQTTDQIKQRHLNHIYPEGLASITDESIRSIITQCISFDPDSRPTLSDLSSNAIFRSDIYSDEELDESFDEKRSTFSANALSRAPSPLPVNSVQRARHSIFATTRETSKNKAPNLLNGDVSHLTQGQSQNAFAIFLNALKNTKKKRTERVKTLLRQDDSSSTEFSTVQKPILRQIRVRRSSRGKSTSAQNPEVSDVPLRRSSKRSKTNIPTPRAPPSVDTESEVGRKSDDTGGTSQPINQIIVAPRRKSQDSVNKNSTTRHSSHRQAFKVIFPLVIEGKSQTLSFNFNPSIDCVETIVQELVTEFMLPESRRAEVHDIISNAIAEQMPKTPKKQPSEPWEMEPDKNEVGQTPIDQQDVPAENSTQHNQSHPFLSPLSSFRSPNHIPAHSATGTPLISSNDHKQILRFRRNSFSDFRSFISTMDEFPFTAVRIEVRKHNPHLIMKCVPSKPIAYSHRRAQSEGHNCPSRLHLEKSLLMSPIIDHRINRRKKVAMDSFTDSDSTEPDTDKPIKRQIPRLTSNIKHSTTGIFTNKTNQYSPYQPTFERPRFPHSANLLGHNAIDTNSPTSLTVSPGTSPLPTPSQYNSSPLTTQEIQTEQVDQQTVGVQTDLLPAGMITTLPYILTQYTGDIPIRMKQNIQDLVKSLPTASTTDALELISRVTRQAGEYYSGVLRSLMSCIEAAVENEDDPQQLSLILTSTEPVTRPTSPFAKETSHFNQPGLLSKQERLSLIQHCEFEVSHTMRQAFDQIEDKLMSTISSAIIRDTPARDVKPTRSEPISRKNSSKKMSKADISKPVAKKPSTLSVHSKTIDSPAQPDVIRPPLTQHRSVHVPPTSTQVFTTKTNPKPQLNKVTKPVRLAGASSSANPIIITSHPPSPTFAVTPPSSPNSISASTPRSVASSQLFFNDNNEFVKTLLNSFDTHQDSTSTTTSSRVGYPFDGQFHTIPVPSVPTHKKLDVQTTPVMNSAGQSSLISFSPVPIDPIPPSAHQLQSSTTSAPIHAPSPSHQTVTADFFIPDGIQWSSSLDPASQANSINSSGSNHLKKYSF